ncbi:MAG: TonB-dependent receptor [Acidobacteria bacterium]|nr:TonB-dependent receptor [Acidobacteriota bacterium]
MRDIPLNARSVLELVPLQTNTVIAEAGDRSATKGFGKKLAIAGQRYTSNSFLLDGADINDAAGSSGSAAQTVAGLEAVREFRIITNANDAEYGRHTGGVISAVTKSGTNRIHGSLFEFLRNDNLDTAEWEDNAFNKGQKAEFKRNQFGSSLGGAAIRDRTFFFGSYEGMRELKGNTRTYTVPTATVHQGLFGTLQFIRGECVVTFADLGVDPAVRPYLDAYPAQTGELRDSNGCVDPNRADYTANNENLMNQDYYSGRMDHEFSDKDFIFGRIVIDNSDRHLPQFNTSQLAETASRYATIERQHIYSPAMLGRTHLSFNRTSLMSFDISRNDFPPVLRRSLGSEPDVPGIISVTSLTGFGGESTNPKIHNQNTFQLKEDLAYSAGEHSLKFGMQFERFQFNQRSDLYAGGGFLFSDIDEFLENRPSNANFIRPGSDNIRGWRENVIGFYLQDDWNVRPGLTLNLGVRYEFIKVPKEVNGKVATVRDLRDENLYSITDQDTDTGDPYFVNPSLRNVAPRIGLAWSPFGSETTSIRAGFGMFHEQIMPSAYITAGVRMAPYFSVAETLQEDLDPLDLTIDFPNMYNTQRELLIGHLCCKGKLCCKPQADGFQHYVEQPAVYKWNLDIQQQVGGDLTVGAGYTGSRGTHLIRGAVQLNHTQSVMLPNPNGPGERRFILLNPGGALRNPHFNRMEWRISDGTSDYHAFHLTVNKRFSRGLQFQSSYTVSKSTDDASTWNDSTDFGDSDRRAYGLGKDHGLSSFDTRNVWTTNFVVDLPGGNLKGAPGTLFGGWRLSGILRFNAGFPLNPSAQQARSRIVIDGERTDFKMRFVDGPTLDLIPGGNQNPVNPQNPNKYIDLSQFALPLTNCTLDVRLDIMPNPCHANLLPGGKIASTGAFLGNIGRNILISPGVANADVALMKETSLPFLSESSILEFRCELFNLFNRPNFGNPELTLYGRNGLTRSGAGRITATRINARQIQLGLHLAF